MAPVYHGFLTVIDRWAVETPPGNSFQFCHRLCVALMQRGTKEEAVAARLPGFSMIESLQPYDLRHYLSRWLHETPYGIMLYFGSMISSTTVNDCSSMTL